MWLAGHSFLFPRLPSPCSGPTVCLRALCLACSFHYAASSRKLRTSVLASRGVSVTPSLIPFTPSVHLAIPCFLFLSPMNSCGASPMCRAPGNFQVQFSIIRVAFLLQKEMKTQSVFRDFYCVINCSYTSSCRGG